jgi:hypothetical protein
MGHYRKRNGEWMWMNRAEAIHRGMPYVFYRYADGLEVLHDRDYRPVCLRRPGQAPVVPDGKAWVDSPSPRVMDEHLYDDATPTRQQRDRAETRLREWGVFDEVMQQLEDLADTSETEDEARMVTEAMTLGAILKTEGSA